jgi:hypothetical protein
MTEPTDVDRLIHGIKRILSHEFTNERNKQRLTDPEKNLELLNFLGSALTIIEMNVKYNLKRLEQGEDIYTIIPKSEQEKDQDKVTHQIKEKFGPNLDS